MPVGSEKVEPLHFLLASIVGSTPDPDGRRLRVCEMFSRSVRQLESAVAPVSARIVLQALQGASLRQIESAIVAVTEAGRRFLAGGMGEPDLQRAIDTYESAWMRALLLAKTQIQDEEARLAANRS